MAREIGNVIHRKRKKWSDATSKSQVMLETPSTEFLEALIREEELEGYLSQKELEVKLICKDGPVFCSRRMLGFSKWFHEQINCREQYGNQLEFNYENYSRSAVKLFTDSLHMLQSGPSDIPVIVECIDFLQFEGKPKSSVFEKMMIERLLTPIIRAAELPLGSELLICLYLSKVDDFENNLFLRNLTDKLTEEKIGSLLFKFDATDELNMSMIKMCVSKQLLDDSKNDSCLYSLMKYGKKLLEERTTEDFLPDPRSVSFKTVDIHKFLVPSSGQLGNNVQFASLNDNELIILDSNNDYVDKDDLTDFERSHQIFLSRKQTRLEPAIIDTRECTMSHTSDGMRMVSSASPFSADMFVTASFDGQITSWENSTKTFRRSFNRLEQRPVMKSKFGRIFATCKGSDIFELDADLKPMHSFQGIDGNPEIIDVSHTHIAVAYSFDEGKILVDVTERNYDELVEQNSESYELRGTIYRLEFGGNRNNTLFTICHKLYDSRSPTTSWSLQAWSVTDKQVLYQMQATSMVIGQEGTPLQGKLVTVDNKGFCRLSNIDTGEKIKETKVSSAHGLICYKVIADHHQTMLVIKSEVSWKGSLTFIDIETFDVVDEVQLEDFAADIAFNKRCNRLLAVTEYGKIMYSKLWSK